MQSSITSFLSQITAWAQAESEIITVILVGSQANGTAKVDSDVDLVILCRQPEKYLLDTKWAQKFGKIKHQAVEDWGKIRSLRVWYTNDLEAEFGLTGKGWLAKPLDEGTRILLQDGYKVLFDRDGLFAI